MLLDNDWIKINRTQVNFDYSNFIELNKKDSIDLAVESIQKKSENLYLALSGGLDSEFVANCLFERGIKFTPILIDYASNHFELWYAKRWCYKNKVIPIILTLSRKEFLNDMFSTSLEYKALPGFFPILTAKRIVKQYNGKLITGLGEVVKKVYSNNEFCSSCEFELNISDFMLDDEDNLLVHFFSESKELFFNYIKEVTESSNVYKNVQMNLSAYYNIIDRPKISIYHSILAHGKEAYDAYKTCISSLGNMNLYYININQHMFINFAKENRKFSLAIGETNARS